MSVVLTVLAVRGTVVGFWIGRMNTRVIVISKITRQFIHSEGERGHINGLLVWVRGLIGNAKGSTRWRKKRRKARCYNEYPAFVEQLQSYFLRRLLWFLLQKASRRIQSKQE